jgi:hypothetical protein
MAYSSLLIFHICGAIVGLLSGTAALIFRKGFRYHRAAGNVFFASMLVINRVAPGDVQFAGLVVPAGPGSDFIPRAFR